MRSKTRARESSTKRSNSRHDYYYVRTRYVDIEARNIVPRKKEKINNLKECMICPRVWYAYDILQYIYTPEYQVYINIAITTIVIARTPFLHFAYSNCIAFCILHLFESERL